MNEKYTFKNTMNEKYTLKNFKRIFDNHGDYSFTYEIIKKQDFNWIHNSYLEYFNIIVEIKDKNDDYIFYEDENVFDLKNGQNIICNMCLDILIGDYDINPEEFNSKLVNMDTFENQFVNHLQI